MGKWEETRGARPYLPQAWRIELSTTLEFGFPLASDGGLGNGHGSMQPILEDYFKQDPVTCARGLIGCHFVWHGCVGRSVETEAYDSVDDPA